MCIRKYFKEQKILKAEGYCRWGGLNVDNPTDEQVNELGKHQFLMVMYEDGTVEAIDTSSKEKKTFKQYLTRPIHTSDTPPKKRKDRLKYEKAQALKTA